jgi:gliding motility-associated-like protein
VKNKFLHIFILFIINFYAINFYCHNDSVLQLARFEENRGQWNNAVKFKTDLINGALFFESNGITTVFTNLSSVSEKAHHLKEIEKNALQVKEEAYRCVFIGSNKNVSIIKNGQSTCTRNYFVGSDKAHWASNVLLYDEIIYQNLYNGIDLIYISNTANIKYDVLVHAGADAGAYKVNYEAHKKLYIDKSGNLICSNSLGQITEQKPFSYQIINGKKVEVKTRFELENESVSFIFPNGYDTNFDLIIDPFLVASTYSGALSDNWGNTACPGPGASMRVAGTSFGIGYPTSLGAFDVSYNGGMDISISSFNASGSTLLASTYVGGGLNDIPYSLITDTNGDLLVIGVSLSTDFPTTVGAFDITHNGNRDMVVFRLNSTFSSLLASTYIGGSANDAYNFTVIGATKYTYADENRSQIRIDNAGNILIASSSASPDFPITPGAYSSTYHGNLDGVVVKLNPSLSTLLFSTYLGGSLDEACTGLQIDVANTVYVCGMTTSSNFPTTPGVISPVANGSADGFVCVLNSTGSSLIASTFLGTANKDGAMYIDLDVTGNVFVFGLSTGGAYPVTVGAYSNPGSSQFLHSLNPTLSTTLFSSVFGNGGNPNISPTAFEVDTCGNIYACGWGRAFDGGTTTGMVTTPGAFSAVTDGSDFYFMVLDRSGSTLLYSTFFGQFGGNPDHVDGGTSLFDANGVVYQAVCASCGGLTMGFPITAGAYSPTNNSSNCNNAVFKFDLEILSPPIASITSATVGCVNVANTFTNSSINAISYYWDFGDGATSVSVNPIHTYTASGIYTISLIAQNNNTCVSSDTTISFIQIYQPTVSVTSALICYGATTTLTASGGSTYLWDNLATTATLSVSPSSTQIYTVQSVDIHNCFSVPATATVNLSPAPLIIVNSPSVCPNHTVVLTCSGAISYTWGLGATTNSIAVSVFSTDSLFTLQGSDSNGCIASITSTVSVFSLPLVTVTSPSVCFGQIATLTASGANTYLWSNGNSTNTFTITPLSSFTLTVIGTDLNFCTSTSTSTLTVLPLPIAVGTATLINGCPPLCTNFIGTSVVGSSTINSWYWNFGNGNISTNQNPSICFESQGTYSVGVSVLDNNGCSSIQNNTLIITVYPLPTADFLFPEFVNIIEPLATFTNTSSNFINSNWNFGDYIIPTYNTSFLINPSHVYSTAGNYCIQLTVDNLFGCTNDTIHCIVVKPEFDFYIPNCFTPGQADGVNDVFTGMGVGIVKYEMWIYDRWGASIFYTDDIKVGWNGKMKNHSNYVKQDVYIWKVNLVDVFDEKHSYVGHVTVLK